MKANVLFLALNFVASIFIMPPPSLQGQQTFSYGISFGVGIPARQKAAEIPASSSTIADGGPTRIVEYSTEKPQMPNFCNALIGINFGGSLRIDIIDYLAKKCRPDKLHIIEGPYPCNLQGYNRVCLTFTKPYRSDPFYASASSSGFGPGSGGYSGSAWENGNYYGITMYVVKISGEGLIEELGEASSFSFAGSQTGSGSSSATFFSGSYSNSSTISPNVAIAEAQKKTVEKFFDPHWWRWFDQSTTTRWFPGAAQVVKATPFRYDMPLPQPVAQVPVPPTTQPAQVRPGEPSGFPAID